ncbi:MAG: ABC transporter substrate-binding protein, partial [Deltaproteobacteria bacterium]|nr:ABC transporter substrate-binding protein [Deltaproteobacteria bacterium]
SDLTESGENPNFFRTIPRDGLQTELLARLVREGGFRSAAVLHDQTDYGETLALLMEEALARDAAPGAAAPLSVGVGPERGDMDAVAARLKASGADAVVWCGYFNGAARLAATLRERGIRAALFGAEAVADDRFIDLAGEAAEGAVVVMPAVPPVAAGAAAEALEGHARVRREEPGPYFLTSAAAVQALLAAAEGAGSADDLDLIKARLTGTEARTALGPALFDSKGDLAGAAFAAYVAKGGRFEPLEGAGLAADPPREAPGASGAAAGP